MSEPRNATALACPKCGSCEWEMEADTRESVTFHVDFDRHVFAEVEREMNDMEPTDWFCMGCKEPAEDEQFEALTAEFVDEKSGTAWESIEVDEWSIKTGAHGGKSYDGIHDGCGVNLPHEHT